VHEVAEALGLPHSSSGEGAERHVALQYVPLKLRKERKAAQLAEASGKGEEGEGEEEEGQALTSIMEKLALLDEGEDSGGEEKAPAPQAPESLQPLPPQPQPQQQQQQQQKEHLQPKAKEATVPPAAAPLASPAAPEAPFPASSEASKPVSLAAQLHAERQARLKATREKEEEAALKVTVAEFGDIVAGKAPKGESRGNRLGGGSGSGGGSGGKDFGVPVAPLQPLHKELSKGGSGRKQAGKKKTLEKEEEEEEEDAFLDAFVASVGKCPVSGCKASTKATGTTCMFCKLRFCLAHGQAEIHGCGDACRAHARGEWLGGKGLATLGAGPVPLTQAKRELLQRELQKKLESGEKERKGGGGKK